MARACQPSGVCPQKKNIPTPLGMLYWAPQQTPVTQNVLQRSKLFCNLNDCKWYSGFWEKMFSWLFISIVGRVYYNNQEEGKLFNSHERMKFILVQELYIKICFILTIITLNLKKVKGIRGLRNLQRYSWHFCSIILRGNVLIFINQLKFLLNRVFCYQDKIILTN